MVNGFGSLGYKFLGQIVSNLKRNFVEGDVRCITLDRVIQLEERGEDSNMAYKKGELMSLGERGYVFAIGQAHSSVPSDELIGDLAIFPIPTRVLCDKPKKMQVAKTNGQKGKEAVGVQVIEIDPVEEYISEQLDKYKSITAGSEDLTFGVGVDRVADRKHDRLIDNPKALIRDGTVRGELGFKPKPKKIETQKLAYSPFSWIAAEHERLLIFNQQFGKFIEPKYLGNINSDRETYELKMDFSFKSSMKFTGTLADFLQNHKGL